ncbi:phage tail protein [Salmonella enterica]|nr:phage tail protein [Salmonella enterica]
MIIGFGNNVVSALASDITSTQTSIPVMPGTGSAFSGLLSTDMNNESTSHGIYAKVTITDAEESVFEVCHLTAVSGDTLTVVRGQEGTTAKSWSLNDKIANFATRGSENAFVQVEQLQAGDYTSAIASGTENALVIDLPSTYQNNGSTDWDLRIPLLVTPTLTNTGAATLQVTMGGRVLGNFPLYKGNKASLLAGDIVAGIPFCCVLDSTKVFFVIINAATDYGSYLEISKNLAEIANNGEEAQSETRQNIGLGDIATHNSSEFMPSTYTAPVTSVNGKIGDVTLSADDVHALPDTYTPPPPDLSAYLTTATANSTYQKINSASKASNGWFKDSNTGMIFQWGIVSGGGSGVNINFPLAFTSSCTNVQATHHRSGAADYCPSVNNYNTMNATIDTDNNAGTIFWYAIGY